jgi:hypothetical protein
MISVDICLDLYITISNSADLGDRERRHDIEQRAERNFERKNQLNSSKIGDSGFSTKDLKILGSGAWKSHYCL